MIVGFTGAPSALIWLKDRFASTSAPRGCDIDTVGSSLRDPRALVLFGRVLLDTLVDLAGRPVGPPGWG